MPCTTASLILGSRTGGASSGPGGVGIQAYVLYVLKFAARSYSVLTLIDDEQAAAATANEMNPSGRRTLPPLVVRVALLLRRRGHLDCHRPMGVDLDVVAYRELLEVFLVTRLD